MKFQPVIFDVWVFRRRAADIEFLLLYTSVEKADRYFNGGRYWQIPSGIVGDAETMTDAIVPKLQAYGLQPRSIWAGEHAYVIYNRRFDAVQAISVFAAEVEADDVTLNPSEHAEWAWLTADECLSRMHYRGLKEGLRSVCEYITTPDIPAPELCLYTDARQI